MTKTLTKPIKWHGGKDYLASWIIDQMPPHLHFVEPYFGGGSVLLQKEPYDSRHVVAAKNEGCSEVVNDLCANLTNFWRIIRCEERFEEFRRLVEMTPFSESEFHDAVAWTEAGGGDDVSRAWRFFILARQSRQGLMKDFATLSRTRTRRGMSEQVSAWLGAVEGLADVHERLKSVLILNRPALDVIRQQDGKDTLFYLDPPYLHETRKTKSDYAHEMSEEDHGNLLLALSKIKGKFLLSGYPSSLYAEAAKAEGWRCITKQIDNKASSKKTKEVKTECLWMNY